MGWSTAEAKILFANNPIRLRKALAPPEVNALATCVARQIRKEIVGPLDDLDSWVATAKALGANVFALHEDETDPGFYDVDEGDIYVNCNADETTICRRLVHELAHHVLIRFKIRPRRRAEERYDDDRKTLEHKIAQRVEALVMGDLLSR